MTKLMLLTGAALIMAASSGFAQSATGTQPAAQAAPSGDLVATAQSQGEFQTLTRAIEAAGMTEQFKSGQFVTLFAPTDAAFAALPAGTVDDLLKPENQARLKTLLSNHMVPGYANAEFLAKQSNSVMATVGGGQVAIASGADGKVTVSGAQVVTADVRATNGLIHGIDKVLLPDQQAGTAGAVPVSAY